MANTGNDHNDGDKFIAGNIRNHLQNWYKLTSDPMVLNIVKGYKIEFISTPVQNTEPKECSFSYVEKQYISEEIKKLMQKQVIERSSDEPGQYVSTIFLRPKKNGKFRMILNLKYLNQHVLYNHFKMDTLQSCLNLMKPSCYMDSIDLTDAYYSVHINDSCQKYLKFRFEGILYKFTCMPNGLGSAPRNFTLLLKPVFSFLRQRGHMSSGYLDDFFLTGDTRLQCLNNIKDTLSILKELGFYINKKKSITTPTKTIEHLGFLIDSNYMTVGISKEKFEKVQSLCRKTVNNKVHIIRDIAQLVGTLVACFPGVKYSQLFYRQLELDKINALKRSCGNFEKLMSLSHRSKTDLSWWISQSFKYRLDISPGAPDFVLRTDASGQGWGAFLEGVPPTGGRWAGGDLFQHINYLELHAALLGLQALCSGFSNKHILLQLDNVTAVQYIRNMGGSHSLPCNEMARNIWEWGKSKNIWLSATHIPGVTNVEADRASRKFNDNTEWKLDQIVFDQIVTKFGKPSIDMFASRINCQFLPYVSWRADPQAQAIDAFTLDWKQFDLMYIFPPFSLMGKVLRKLQAEGGKAIVMAPKWPTQTWYSRLLRLTKGQPMLLPKKKTLLQLPSDPGKLHPLYPKITMIACFLSAIS